MSGLKERLDAEVRFRNCPDELCDEKPDPLMVARKFGDEWSALTCALFAYGNVRSIVAFLESLDMSLIEKDEDEIRCALNGKYYRFQNSEDIIQWFITLKRFKQQESLETCFQRGFIHNGVLGGMSRLIQSLYDVNPYSSRGYTFLIGKPIKKMENASAMKRWMMYLRWMVRHDRLDMGLWQCMGTSELIMPLDTHTFTISHSLGLLKRKQCDMRAALELTEKLKEFDREDPVKYDFALYRIGQEGISETLV